jgi:glycosyltransferase involved in cell wall biosynthesis
LAKNVNPNIYHFHDPELLPFGLLLSWTGKHVIYDAHEDLPRQILSKYWIPLPLRKVVSVVAERVENFIARRVSGVVAATPHIAARFSLLNSRTVDINNYPLPDELAPPITPTVKKAQVCYVGGISRIRGIRQLVEALQYAPEIKLVLCGRFSEPDLRAELEALPGWSRVDYLGQVDRGELQQIMAESLAGIVTFLPLPNHTDAQPNKMFEYMSAGLPVIASNFPLWREIVDGARAGLCVDPESPTAIAAAIMKLRGDADLAEQFGVNARTAVLTRFNWPVEAQKLIKFYEELL